MSIFAVFGMTEDFALAEARKNAPAHRFEKDDGGARRRVELTTEERERAVKARAEKTMASTRRVQLCKAYTAPQFAREYMDRLRERGGVRDLCIKVKTTKKDASGNPVTTKKGKPIMRWQSWVDEAKA